MRRQLSRRSFLTRTVVSSIGASVLIKTSGVRASASSLEKILNSGKVSERFGPASNETISAYEQKYNTRFSWQYRAFLMRTNGLGYHFDFDGAEKRGVSPILADMNTFFGVGNGNKYNDLAIITETMGFIRKKLLHFGPVIGVGGDFCTYVEVSHGRYEGQIMYVDGEMRPNAAVGNRPIETLSVDEFVTHSIAQGRYMPVASSFDGLLAEYAKMT